MSYRRLGLALGLMATLPAVSAAAANAPYTVTQLMSAIATPSGQPLVMPQGNVRVMVSTYDIAPGAKLPIHRHPYPRYGYVLAGTLRVTDTDTGQSWDYKTGDFIVEVVGQWHFGENTGTTPVKLLVIDVVPKVDTRNTVLKPTP
jgi:quercetin dioxygenase-like cupin family protein